MKRVISILLSAFFIVSSVPGVIAADNSKNIPKREILDSLGVMSIDSDSEFVTRNEFFKGLLNMVYDDVKEEAVRELLVIEGLIADESDIMFAGEKFITYNDAVTAVVTILGYDRIAILNGDYPAGYKKIAQQIGLLSGVTGGRTLALERDAAVNLLYNAIKAEPCITSFGSYNVRTKTAKDETVLSVKKDIFEISGMVEANQYTSLYSPDGNAEAQITIDGENYYINGTNAGELLGYYVEGYVQKDKNDDGKVVYLAPKQGKTSEIRIEDENVLAVNDDISRIEYCREDGKTVKTAKISPNVKVIYNGKFYDKYIADDFVFDKGYLKLVDNNNDNEYDCIFVNSYETMIVDYTTRDNEIYGKYTYSDALNYVKFEDTINNPNIHYYLGDEEVAFSKINKDDVLTIKRSKGDTDILADVYITRNVIAGSANGIDNTDYVINIDGTEYGVSKVFYRETENTGKITLLESYNFYMDYFGELVYAKKTTSSNYALFYKVFEDDTSDTSYKIKYLNDQSEWCIASVSSKVKYNGSMYSSRALYEELDAMNPQVMIIKVNSKGEVKEVITAVMGKKGEVPLAKNAEQKMNYHSNPAAFDYSLHLESTAKVFVIPSTDDADYDEYYVTTRSYFASDKDYLITPYDVDEFNYTDVVSVSVDATTKLGKVRDDMYVVTDKYESLDAEGSPITMIECSTGAYHGLVYEVDDSANPDGINRGSIIKIHLDRTKIRIDNWVNVADELNSLSESLRDDRYLYGTVTANDYNSGKLKIECDGVYGYFGLNKSASVLIYDFRTDNCGVGTTKDIVPGDEVYLYTHFAVPQNIVVVRR